MKIRVNGEDRRVPDGVTAVELLEILEVRTDAVAVEVNGEVVRRATLREHRLHEGDRVEIVSFVGGG